MFKCINVTHSTICPLCTVCWCQKLNLRLLLKVALATQLPGCSAFCCVAAGFEVNLSVDAVAACWVLQLLTWRGPGWQVHRVGCNLLCPQHSMQYSCIRAPVLCLYKKRKSSPCSDGEAGQTHHIHTSETHAKEWLGLIIDSFLKYHLLKNILCIRFHLLYTTFIFNLDVKSLYKCGQDAGGIINPPASCVEKPLLIVLSHLRGLNLHPRGLSTPTPRKTQSECHLRLLTLLHTDEAANNLREQYSQ